MNCPRCGKKIIMTTDKIPQIEGDECSVWLDQWDCRDCKIRWFTEDKVDIVDYEEELKASILRIAKRGLDDDGLEP